MKNKHNINMGDFLVLTLYDYRDQAKMNSVYIGPVIKIGDAGFTLNSSGRWRDGSDMNVTGPNNFEWYEMEYISIVRFGDILHGLCQI